VEDAGRKGEREVEERRPDRNAAGGEVHERVEEDRFREMGDREPRAAQVVVVVVGHCAGARSVLELPVRREPEEGADRDRRREAEDEDRPARSHSPHSKGPRPLIME